MVESLLRPDDFVVEIGCGNGRDGLLLSSSVRQYHGLDISEAAIAKSRQSFEEAGVDPSRYLLSVRDFSQVDFEREESDRLVIYSRFSLHADTDEAQELLLQHVSSIPGRVLFLVEARTIHDELYGQGTLVGRHSYVTDHFRRFIDPEEFRARVAEDFAIEHLSVDRGYAAYGDEDPPVLRAVLSREMVLA